MNVKEALLSVADDIASGDLRPGFGQYFQPLSDVPCCSIGHVLSRAGLDSASELYLKGGTRHMELIDAVIEANDRSEWEEVIRLLREDAEEVWEARNAE